MNDSALSTLGVHENVESNNSDFSKANIETVKRLRKDERGIRGQILLGDKPKGERPPLDARIGLALETTLSFCRDGRKGA